MYMSQFMTEVITKNVVKVSLKLVILQFDLEGEMGILNLCNINIEVPLKSIYKKYSYLKAQ